LDRQPYAAPRRGGGPFDAEGRSVERLARTLPGKLRSHDVDIPFTRRATLPHVSRLTSALIGRDATYFNLFEAAATNLVRAADLLDQMMAAWPERPELARDILVCEQDGDRITHDIVNRLNQTFVTPIEREDILELATGLDDVCDFIEEVSDYMGLYKIEAPMEQAQRLAHILLQASRQISEAMPLLRDFGDLGPHSAEIHRLENDGDRVVREAMASLFDNGIDPMVVIRWKDIYERLEDAIDATERVANILSNIVIKNA
jgi:predicted phosphate transport protein (TIGR00153 family)